ncbi:MAG: MerR family DNA-binding transcriptional regulator [Haloechinothrix sp.]
MAADPEERWLPISAASRALGMSRTTLLVAEEAGLVTPIRTPGGHRRYRLAELRRYLGRTGAGRPVDVALVPQTSPAPDEPDIDTADLAVTVRAAVRPLVRALDGDSAGLYLVQDGTLAFCAAFGIPRWLAERLRDSPPPAPVTQALETRRHRHFDPAAVAFPEPRAAGHGVAVALRRDDRALGVLFLVTRPERELLAGELRVVDAFRELITTVVDDRQRIADLENRLARIATLSAG